MSARSFPAIRRRSCRSCGATLARTVVDLGATPLANSYLTADELDGMEPSYPLRARICGECLLMQLDDYEAPETIFGEYAYFSSYSDSWLEHSRRWADEAVQRFGLGPQSRVVELASNDGYLLQYLQGHGVPVLGVEPARNVAAVAEQRGIPTVAKFFGRALARELAASSQADLVIANNVLAHVPDLDDFIGGIAILLAPGGTLTVEFPHVAELVADVQFDTIYHEHFSYFSLHSAAAAFAARGLEIVDVERLPTHGGSLRIHVRHAGAAPATSHAGGAERVATLLEDERDGGLHDPATYARLAERAPGVRRALRRFLDEQAEAGRSVAAYGAAAKGNTLLNYCGLGQLDIGFCVDRNPHKQGTWLPGSRIPVLAPDAIDEHRPDVILILPWNLREEVVGQLDRIRAWGGSFAWRTADGVATG